MSKIPIYGEFESKTLNGVLADGKQIRGAYMVLTTAQRESLSTALIVDGMRVYDSDEKLEYRWNANTSAWDVIPTGGSQPENFLVSAHKSDDGKTLYLTTNKGEVVDFQGGGKIFEEVTEVPATPSSQVIYIYNHNHELTNIELQAPFNFTTYAKSEAVNLRWNEDYTKLLATMKGVERELTMSEIKSFYDSEMSQYIFASKDVSEPESEYQIPLFYPSESTETFDIGLFSYEDTSESFSVSNVFAHTMDDIKVTSVSLYQYYNGIFQPLLITVDYSNVKNKPTLNGVSIEGDKSNEDYGLFRVKTLFDGPSYTSSVMSVVKNQSEIKYVDIQAFEFTNYAASVGMTFNEADKSFIYINEEGMEVVLSSENVLDDYTNERNYFTNEDTGEVGKFFLFSEKGEGVFKIDTVVYMSEATELMLLSINEPDPGSSENPEVRIYVCEEDGSLHELSLASENEVLYGTMESKVTIKLTDLSCDIETTITGNPGDWIEGHLIPNEGCLLPNSITFGSNIDNGLYDSLSGYFSFSIPFVDDTITAVADYEITISVTNGSLVMNKERIGKGETVLGVLSANDEYLLPSTINVTGASYSYSQGNGVVKIYNATSRVNIQASCITVIKSIIPSITNGTYSGDTQIRVGGVASGIITPSAGYVLPAAITVKNASHNYNRITGEVTITNPTDTVVVSATCKYEELSITALDDNSTVGITIQKYDLLRDNFTDDGVLSDEIHLDYSKDNGTTWSTFFEGVSGSSITVTLNANETMLLRGNTQYFAEYSEQNNCVYLPHFNLTGRISMGGSVSSLINDASTLRYGYTFFAIFHDCTALIQGPDIALSALSGDVESPYAYALMFKGCTNMIKGPSTLSLKVLDEGVYSEMFSGCSSLTTPPIITIIQSGSWLYSKVFVSTFYNCSSLKVRSSSGTAFITTYSGIESMTDTYRYMFRGTAKDASVPDTPTTHGTTYYYEL